VAITSGGSRDFLAAMIAALWATTVGNNITFLAGEVKNPGRNLPLRVDRRRLRGDGPLSLREPELLSAVLRECVRVMRAVARLEAAARPKDDVIIAGGH